MVKLHGDMEITIKFSTEDKAIGEEIRDSICRHLVGNEDFINNTIVISDSDANQEQDNDYKIHVILGHETNFAKIDPFVINFNNLVEEEVNNG